MRTAASWATFAILGACAFALGAKEKVFFGAAVPPSSTPQAADGPPDAVLTALIADLGSDDYRTREKAGAALEARGDKILPDLRRALTTTESPEIARRLAVIVRRMDHERLVAPRKVTLSIKDKPAKAAFDEIAKQTGYKIEFNNNGGDNAQTKYSFEFDKAPFWQAIDKVAEVANLSVQADYDDEIVRVNSYQDTHNPYVSYAGPFRFVATGINSNRSVQLNNISKRGVQNNRPSEYINLSFQVHSEPKNPILGTLPAELTTAIDDTGSSLVPPKDGNGNGYRSGYYQQGYRGHNAYGNVNLVRGAKDATTIKTMKGKMGIILLAGVVPEIVIADPLKTKSKTIAGRNVELVFDSLTEANGQFSVVVTVKKLGIEDPNNIDYNWGNSIWQKLELVDDKGKRYHSNGPSMANNNGQSVQLTIAYTATNRQGQPEKLGPPTKLIMNEWLSVTHEVTFEFKDIPLP